MTQEALQDASGIDRSVINQIENGRRNVTADTMESLAEGLGVHVFELKKGRTTLPGEIKNPKKIILEPDDSSSGS